MAEQKSKSDLLWTYSWLILALDIYIYSSLYMRLYVYIHTSNMMCIIPYLKILSHDNCCFLYGQTKLAMYVFLVTIAINSTD